MFCVINFQATEYISKKHKRDKKKLSLVRIAQNEALTIHAQCETAHSNTVAVRGENLEKRANIIVIAIERQKETEK